MALSQGLVAPTTLIPEKIYVPQGIEEVVLVSQVSLAAGVSAKRLVFRSLDLDHTNTVAIGNRVFDLIRKGRAMHRKFKESTIKRKPVSSAQKRRHAKRLRRWLASRMSLYRSYEKYRNRQKRLGKETTWKPMPSDVPAYPIGVPA